jgi:hypothetical protein
MLQDQDQEPRRTGTDHRRNIGQPFNPWREVCGFYPQDVVGRQRKLVDSSGVETAITGNQKRLFDRLVRFAGMDARCFPSQERLAYELGESERQVRKDLAKLESFGLVRHAWREGRRSNTYEFLWHPIYELERNQGFDKMGTPDSVERNCSSSQPEGYRNCDSGQKRSLSGTPDGLSGTARNLSGTVVPPTTETSNTVKPQQQERSGGVGILAFEFPKTADTIRGFHQIRGVSDASISQLINRCHQEYAAVYVPGMPEHLKDEDMAELVKTAHARFPKQRFMTPFLTDVPRLIRKRAKEFARNVEQQRRENQRGSESACRNALETLARPDASDDERELARELLTMLDIDAAAPAPRALPASAGASFMQLDQRRAIESNVQPARDLSRSTVNNGARGRERAAAVRRT